MPQRNTQSTEQQSRNQTREAYGVRPACRRCRIQVTGSVLKSAGKPDALHTLRAKALQAAQVDRL